MEIEKTNIKISSENLRTCTPKGYKPVTITEKEYKASVLNAAIAFKAQNAILDPSICLSRAEGLIDEWINRENIEIVRES
jgi:hypothetical protein